MLENMGMFFYKKSDDRYGRGATLRKLSCPVCENDKFIQQQMREADKSTCQFDIWTCSCVMCTHMLAFRRQLEKANADQYPSGD